MSGEDARRVLENAQRGAYGAELGQKLVAEVPKLDSRLSNSERATACVVAAMAFAGMELNREQVAAWMRKLADAAERGDF